MTTIYLVQSAYTTDNGITSSVTVAAYKSHDKAIAVRDMLEESYKSTGLIKKAEYSIQPIDLK